jgi:hypothetical protein
MMGGGGVWGWGCGGGAFSMITIIGDSDELWEPLPHIGAVCGQA